MAIRIEYIPPTCTLKGDMGALVFYLSVHRASERAEQSLCKLYCGGALPSVDRGWMGGWGYSCSVLGVVV